MGSLPTVIFTYQHIFYVNMHKMTIILNYISLSDAAQLMCICVVQKLTRDIQSRQANGFEVIQYNSGVARDTAAMHGPLANLHFLVVLCKASD